MQIISIIGIIICLPYSFTISSPIKKKKTLVIMDKISQYFDNLNADQLAKFIQLKPLYQSYNEKVNLISRKDMDAFYLHHVLHSLSLSAFISWTSKCKILDLGTGGGFPLIPLAILYPEVEFTGIDGTGKKIKAVQFIANELQLNNVQAFPTRAEDFDGRFHYIISRAVCTLSLLSQYSNDLLYKKSICPLPNGIIAYKGGDLKNEINDIQKQHYYEIWDIHSKFPEPYFIEKKLVYLQGKE
ncbi:MAG: 16S rRNA (guanine(527)-N(7))-methyltransferase RsmG [Saprospiraceae bacterium]|nr:16S rRNA (guanine(527)-N(7))-methyltransferase RsmG [Saprospiraceae bacterium]